MKSYINIVEEVLSEGTLKKNRTGVDALTIPFVHFKHNMASGFPLLTTKKMYTKGILVELEGFLKGITDKTWYQSRGCNIWNEWANPVTVKEIYEEQFKSCLDLNETPETLKDIQKEESDLGPIYGYQWRKHGEHYGYLEGPEHNAYYGLNGSREGFDQLRAILTSLTNNPSDRRMVCSAWNPGQHHMMALPPCHVLWNVVVINDVLNLGWYQRSCDLMLGVPYNIASYATLMLLLCKHSSLKPGILSGTLGDCHIYENHVKGAEEQIKRDCKSLPKCTITIDKPFDLTKLECVLWTHKDIEFSDYNPHPSIKFEVAV